MGRKVEMDKVSAPKQELLPKDDKPGQKRTIDKVHACVNATGIFSVQG